MKIIGTVIGIIGLFFGSLLLAAFPIKWTWNATMPFIFGLPVLTWGKAWCLCFLCSALFKTTNINNK